MADSPRDCTMILAQTGAALRPLIRLRVNTLPPKIRHIPELHFGWWADQGSTVDTVRPAPALLACQAVGGEPRASYPAAVAVELVHNASLLHDDIIGQDPLPRGRPTLWAPRVPAAILAGNALFFAAVQTLTDAPRLEQTLPILLASVQALIEGEYLDTLIESDTDVSADRVLGVAAGKTGELLACA
ncbi:polyprenyl synthetase family protein [Streptomyces sp. NPDC005533]|uniref:polyprenyl synthetase family protein n=1 Tax=Streptomyces sp. NPDC005533 TaxID=3364723 RepID=UPI0036770D0E